MTNLSESSGRMSRFCPVCRQDVSNLSYVADVGMLVCKLCEMEWLMRREMAALGWIKGAPRPSTDATGAKQAEPGDAGSDELQIKIGGND